MTTTSRANADAHSTRSQRGKKPEESEKIIQLGNTLDRRFEAYAVTAGITSASCRPIIHSARQVSNSDGEPLAGCMRRRAGRRHLLVPLSGGSGLTNGAVFGRNRGGRAWRQLVCQRRGLLSGARVFPP